MSRKRVTLREVAKAAGVSINTVSRALNGKPDVNEETRRRVVRTAERLNYRPNRFAQGLRGQRTGTLGVVVADLSNPFFVEVTRGIEEEARRRGYTIILTNSGEDPDKEQEAIETLLEHQVAGILITPSQKSDAFFDVLAGEEIPYVLVARRFEEFSSYAVLNDDFTGAYQAVDYLLQLGHRKILFINGPTSNWSAVQRLNGYRQAIERRSIPYDHYSLVQSCDVTAEAAGEAILRYVDGDGLPDAVFTFSDYMAMGVVRALKSRGYRVPQDVSVMGYDGIEVGALLDPPLSTVEIPKHQLGVTGTQVLLSLVEGDQNGHAPQQVMLPPKVLVRGSTAPQGGDQSNRSPL